MIERGYFAQIPVAVASALGKTRRQFHEPLLERAQIPGAGQFHPLRAVGRDNPVQFRDSPQLENGFWHIFRGFTRQGGHFRL